MTSFSRFFINLFICGNLHTLDVFLPEWSILVFTGAPFGAAQSSGLSLTLCPPRDTCSRSPGRPAGPAPAGPPERAGAKSFGSGRSTAAERLGQGGLARGDGA
ncbi:hypothetical protein BDW69DRAFT_190008 [Aspergillus filifer]